MTTNITLQASTVAELRQLTLDLFPPSQTPGPPPDTNVYPLHMTPVANPGDPVNLGKGPDSLMLMLGGGNLGTNSIAVVMDNVAIAAPLTVTNPPSGAHQTFTINGSWGPLPHTVLVTSSGQGVGLANLWFDGVSYNYVPLVYNGPSTDARGGPDAVNAAQVWDNTGTNITWTLPVQVPTPPGPAGSPIITGATINDIEHPPAILTDLIFATPTNGTLTLPAGTWSGTSSIPNACTIRGAGTGKTIIDATGLDLSRGKGILVPLISGVDIRELTLRGASVPDLNGAGIREDGPGIAWTAHGVEITGCQDGILTFASTITLTNCSFHDNGAHDEHSHEMYFNGSPATTVVLENVVSVAGINSTHALKSRAGTTRISGGSFTGNPDGEPGGVTGAVINIPDGGMVSITDTSLIIASSGTEPNIQFLLYGSESAKNGSGAVILTGVHLTDRSGTGGMFSNHPNTPAAKLVISTDCTYAGPKPPQFQNWASVTGQFTPIPTA